MGKFKKASEESEIDSINNDFLYHLRTFYRTFKNVDFKVVAIVDDELQVEIRSSRSDFDTDKFSTRENVAFGIARAIQERKMENGDSHLLISNCVVWFLMKICPTLTPRRRCGRGFVLEENTVIIMKVLRKRSFSRLSRLKTNYLSARSRHTVFVMVY